MKKNSSPKKQQKTEEGENYASLKWLTTDGVGLVNKEAPYKSPYEDVTKFNTCRVILDALGKEQLDAILQDSVDMLETSVAIYEKNGDYAAGNFLSGWCQGMDAASFKLCETTDTKKALDCGKWLCHDCCWGEISEPAIKTGKINDLPCVGGINIYAVPIFAFGEVIGAINFGWGDPPTDLKKLEELSKSYKIPVETLQKNASRYRSRPKFILEIAKKRLLMLADFIGKTVELKQTQKNLEKAKIEADSANTAKSEFLANMSHEIRTPMNAVIGFSEQLINSITDEKQKTKASIIHSSGENLLKIINDILDLSKIEAGKIELCPTPTNLHSLIDEVQTIFELKTSKKNISLDVVFKNITEPYLMLDEVRMRQILFNLISNAVKFTEKGSVTININTEKTKNNKVTLTIEVSDTGIGIPKDQLKNIFTPFTQQRGQSVIKYGGTGLGLPITTKLVHKMDGKIQVKSTPDIGSTFSVTIPNIPISTLDVHTEKALFNPHTFVFEKAILLVVDDIEINRKLIIDSFDNSPDLEILEASNGKYAIDLAKKHLPDLILMDINMPEMDGCEASKIIKKNKTTKHTPIIAVSVDSKNEICDTIDLFEDFITIPIDTQTLVNKIKKHIPHHIVKSKENVNTVNKKTEYKFTKKDKEILPELIEILEKDFLPIHKKLLEKNTINDIAEFGKELSKLGEKLKTELLTDYSNNIGKYTDSFDIDNLTQTLKEFPLLIEQLKQKKNT